jgi:hypothetical protein
VGSRVSIAALTRSRALGALMLVGGVVMLTPPAYSAISGAGGGNLPDPAMTGAVLTPADEPTLEASERDRVQTGLRADQRLASLLHGQPYDAVQSGVWARSGARSQEKLGAFVRIKLRSPSKLTGSWPTMIYDTTERSATPFTESTVDQTVDAVSELFVLVALPSGRVVNVVPGPPPSPAVDAPTATQSTP